MEIYLDHAATTTIDPAVRDLMLQVLEQDFGNPSSMHMKGVDAEEYIRKASEEVARAIGAKPKEIVFTSGGTESNNLAIIGGAMAHRRAGKHIITSKIEHASVLSPMDFLAKEGYEITYIGTDEHGRIDVRELADAIREDTILVSLMYVNNEIGAIEPISEIAKLIHAANPRTLFHVDAVQAFGKLSFKVATLGCDLLSMSGHKIHGPKGSGALYIKDKTLIRPIIYGGGQQRDMRSGTENVPAIAGMGLATERIYDGLAEKMERVARLKKKLIDGATALPDVVDHSGEAPHVVSLSFVGVRAEVMLHALEDKGVYVSAGSACSSNKKKESGVLHAIGLPKEQLESTLRFSLSDVTTEEEIDGALAAIGELLPVLRRYTAK